MSDAFPAPGTEITHLIVVSDVDRSTPWLPTSRLPHGKADAQFHVILAKAWAQDTHLVRDIAICSTTEL